MQFNYSKEGLSGREKTLQRIFEIVPGLTSWSLLLGMLALSFWNPLLAVMIIIAFDFYWFLRLLYMTIFLILSYLRLSIEGRTDWLKRIHDLVRLYSPESFEPEQALNPRIKEYVSDFIHRKEMQKLRKNQIPLIPSENIYHLVIFPIIKEGKDILEQSLLGLANQRFPLNHLIVVLALEERADPAIKSDIEQAAKIFDGVFADLLVIVHPEGLTGEARVKGANISYAARECRKYFDAKKIPFENIIVSCFDADTIASPQYFGCLTYQYLICPQRTLASFQPIPVYNNNIWETPPFTRVIEMGSSFFQLIESTNPEKLVTFSSHSMSFKALVEVDYWPPDLISDDSSIFWKAFIHYDGNYQVIPLYVTLSMDAVSADSWLRTAQNVYKQRRRWAWGVENFPIVMRAFLRAKKIKFTDKLRYGFKLFESNISWATWPFLLSFISWIPLVAGGKEFSSSVLYFNTPRITTTIFNLSTISLVITVFLSLSLLPRPDETKSIWKRAGFAFEWISIPVILIFLSAVPALDAQTRLMFGRYMEFWVTDKKRYLK